MKEEYYFRVSDGVRESIMKLKTSEGFDEAKQYISNWAETMRLQLLSFDFKPV